MQRAPWTYLDGPVESLTLECPNPADRPVRALRRTIQPDPGARAIDLTREITVRRPRRLPIGPHPRALAPLPQLTAEPKMPVPAPARMMFLPQRPDMRLGDLRQQITYPRRGSVCLSDAELQAILERVRLPDVAARAGGFSAQRDWGRILLLGEQQRIAFARILATGPRHGFLDEATSALDPTTEQVLCDALRATGATIVSVAHRPSLMAHHNTVLRLSPAGWTLEAFDRQTCDAPARLRSS